MFIIELREIYLEFDRDLDRLLGFVGPVGLAPGT